MSSAAAQEFKERVRDAVDIVDLVSGYVPLQRRGRIYVGLCPFHDDTRPSLQVSQERQTYRCWACGAGGDVFAFVMQREGLEFRDALEFLADRSGVPHPQRGDSAAGTGSRKQLFAALAWAANQFHEQLLTAPAAQEARDYLQERGLSTASIGRFRLGFAPDGWQWLRDRAASAGFADATLEAAGLVSRSATSERPYDRFRRRLIFPICDAQGRVIAFGGRVLPSDSGDSMGKYINSPESPLFSKSHHLYGLHIAREAISQQNCCVVVEGYTDAIMAWQQQVECTVAVLGTALGTRHVQLLQRYANRVVLVLDGDAAGRRRANEVLELFMANPIDLKVATLPSGMDPCDFLLHRGGGQFRSLLDQAPDALAHKLSLVTESVDLIRDLPAANAALEELLRLVALIPQAGKQDASWLVLRSQQAVGLLSRVFRLTPEILQARLREMRGRVATRSAPVVPTATRLLDPWDAELFTLLLRRPDLAPRAVDQVPGSYLGSSAGRELLDLLKQLLSSKASPVLPDWLMATEDGEIKRILVDLDAAAAALQQSEADIDGVLEELLAAFRRRAADQEARSGLTILEEPTLSEQEQVEALVRIVDQQRNRQGISVPMEG